MLRGDVSTAVGSGLERSSLNSNREKIKVVQERGKTTFADYRTGKFFGYLLQRLRNDRSVDCVIKG
jgi:hypothetical protein